MRAGLGNKHSMDMPTCDLLFLSFFSFSWMRIPKAKMESIDMYKPSKQVD